MPPAMPERFHWILEGQLAGMSQPGLFAELTEDLRALKEAGVGAVATLTEYELPQKFLQAEGLVGRHFPIDDFSVPTVKQTHEFCDWVDEQLDGGRSVAAHCYAGLGRTGTMIACYLVYVGGTTREVLEQIRRKEPGYVQTPAQEAFIAVWESHLVDEEG